MNVSIPEIPIHETSVDMMVKLCRFDWFSFSKITSVWICVNFGTDFFSNTFHKTSSFNIFSDSAWIFTRLIFWFSRSLITKSRSFNFSIIVSESAVFIDEEKEIINYISGYYNEIMPKADYVPINTATSNIKTQINGAILSVFYQMNINLDETLFDDNIKSYNITTNIDLGTGRTLTTEDLLTKYNYTKKYIAEKIFEEDVLIGNGEVVTDKNTNISLTKQDVERRKEEYVERITSEFNNIIKVYIENNYLTIVYDKKELNDLFFDNKFDTDIKIRYLK